MVFNQVYSIQQHPTPSEGTKKNFGQNSEFWGSKWALIPIFEKWFQLKQDAGPTKIG